MPSPLDIPKRPSWRYEPVRVAGKTVLPLSMSAAERQVIDSRLSSQSHATENDENDRLSS